MTTLTVHDAPTVGTTYCKHSTGRTWHVTRICDSGLVALTEDLFDCERRDYVTDAELASEYAPMT